MLSGVANEDQRVRFDNLAVDTSPGAQTTVEFWVNWKGKNNSMPMGWDSAFDLYFTNGLFGVNLLQTLYNYQKTALTLLQQ